MPAPLRTHRVLAVVVLVLTGIWVATGKISSVGSEAAETQAAERPATVDEAPSLRTVAVVKPSFFQHAREIRVSGVTAPDKNTVLAARSSGIIVNMRIAQGQRVEADTVVVQLEASEATADLANAEALVAQRQREADVAEELFRKGNIPELQLTAVKADRAAAEAQLSQAKAAVDRLSLRAPFSGVIEAVAVELGEWVQIGTPVATLLALDPIVVLAEISEIDIGYIKKNMAAKVRLVTGQELDGTVRYVAREASGQTRTFAVEVTMPNPDFEIPSGMTAEVRLYAPPVSAVRIPRSIITLSQAGELGLRVVDANNKTGFVAVELIDDTPDGLVITGIPEGVRVIVTGQDLVGDGEEVIVTDVTPQLDAQGNAVTGAQAASGILK